MATAVLIQGMSFLLVRSFADPSLAPTRSSSSVSWRRSSRTVLLEAGVGGDLQRARAGRVDLVIERIRPGRAESSTTRSARNTASAIECVTNTTVAFVASRDPLKLHVHLVARHRVERAERLVHEQDLGVVAQGPGDRDALAHAAGELARERLLEALQADELAELVRPPPALAPCRPCAAAAAGAMFSSTVNQGNRLASWKTRPSLRSASSSRWSPRHRGLPATVTA